MRTALFLSLFPGLTASAHQLDLVRVEATFLRDGTYRVDFLVDADRIEPWRPAESSSDKLLRNLKVAARFWFDDKLTQPESSEVTRAADAKPNILRLRLRGQTRRNVSRFTLENRAIQGFFTLKLRNEGHEPPLIQWVEKGAKSAPFPLKRAVVPASRPETMALYFSLGYQHILPRGLDHVLFVLGIFLLSVELRPVLWQVTAFTLAHTIALALTTLGIVSLSSGVVEPLIALSIVCVAVENVLTFKMHAWRPILVFCFGLLHGMGFAGVLMQIGLPRTELTPALIAFNLGVEGGQLTVILGAFLALGLPFRDKPWYRSRVVVPCSLAIAVIGLSWSIERLLAPN